MIKDPEERWSVDQLLKHPFIKTARGPGFLQPLVDEVLEAIEDAGGRDKAMGFSTIDDSKTKQSTGGYVSSGSEPDMYSTIVVRGEEEEEEEEEEDDEGGYGTLVRKNTSKSKKNGSNPAFLKHIQNSKATENEVCIHDKISIYNNYLLINIYLYLVFQDDCKGAKET